MFMMIGESILHRGGGGSEYTCQETRESTLPEPEVVNKCLTDAEDLG